MKKKFVYTSPSVKSIPRVSEEEKSVFEIENLEEDTGFLMLQVSNLWKNFHGKTLKKYGGLTHMQYAVLAGIYWFTLHGTKQVTQTMLANYTRIDPMTLSHVFRGLEVKGYILRIIYPTNARAKAVHLTQEGKDLMDQAISSIVEADQKFFKSLGKNTDYFNSYLKKLLETNN